MKRLDSNVGSFQRTLEKRPEVVDALRMNLAAHVLTRVCYDFMGELILQTVVADEIIRIDSRSESYLFQYLVLQCLAPYIGNDLGAHLPQIAVKHSEHNRFRTVYKTAFNLACFGLQL